LTISHCILHLVEAGHGSRGAAGPGAPDEADGSTMERDFAVDSLQISANGNSPTQLLVVASRARLPTATKVTRYSNNIVTRAP
jgi:hypothetical protein